MLQANVFILSQKEMIDLKNRFFGIKKPTDVLSFPAHEIFKKEGFLGELFICFEVLKKQALERNHSLEHELDVLLIHGFFTSVRI